MTLREREYELEALAQDEEYIGSLVSGLDTPRLHILANAIGLELRERYEGKPLDKLMLH